MTLGFVTFYQQTYKTQWFYWESPWFEKKESSWYAFR